MTATKDTDGGLPEDSMKAARQPTAAVFKLGRRVWHEALLHARTLSAQRRRPSVVVFPSNQPWDAASNLRAWLVAPELEKLGWRVLVVPAFLSLSQRRRILARARPDAVLIQQTRHDLNDPALYSPYPCVLDIDDADVLDPRIHARVGARAASAAAVVCGSRFIAQQLRSYNANTHVIWTGTPDIIGPPRPSPSEREPIVAWAHSEPLRYPLEAALVQRVMTEVVRRTKCTFWLFGTSESDAKEWLAPLRAAGGTCEAIASLPYEDYLGRVRQAAVGLHPVCIENEFSRGKSFGKLLAYLSEQVAVVTTNTIDHPLFFRDHENGLLVENDADAWISAIEALVENPQLRHDVAMKGFADYRSRLTTRKFAALLDGVLRSV